MLIRDIHIFETTGNRELDKCYPASSASTLLPTSITASPLGEARRMGTHSTDSFSEPVLSCFNELAESGGGDGDRGGDTDLGDGDWEEVEYPVDEVGELLLKLDLGACEYTGLNLCVGSAFVRLERDGAV